MNALGKQLFLWWTSLWNYLFRRSRSVDRYHAIYINDDQQLPKKLVIYKVYIIGVPGNEWLAEMLCPCGCGEILFLNLLQEEMPNWKWHVHTDGTLTLSPSIWRQVRCKSHFFLKEGTIEWCTL